MLADLEYVLLYRGENSTFYCRKLCATALVEEILYENIEYFKDCPTPYFERNNLYGLYVALDGSPGGYDFSKLNFLAIMGSSINYPLREMFNAPDFDFKYHHARFTELVFDIEMQQASYVKYLN